MGQVRKATGYPVTQDRQGVVIEAIALVLLVRDFQRVSLSLRDSIFPVGSTSSLCLVALPASREQSNFGSYMLLSLYP